MKILVTYHSKTGFTEKYATLIANQLNCKIIPFKQLKNDEIKNYDIVIFGSRIIAGKISKLKTVKNLVINNNIKKLILFTTGATPNEASDVLNKIWHDNLTKEELKTIPHFHLQSGMCLEKLPLLEKFMIKMAKIMMKNKKDKNSIDSEFENTISKSFDISNEVYIQSLIQYVKEIDKNDYDKN